MNFFKSEIAEKNTFIRALTSRGYNIIPDNDLWNKGYLGNNIVYSVIVNIVNRLASLPIQLMNNDEAVTDDNDIYKLFYDNWNSKYGHEEGLRLVATNLLIFGVCYIQKKGDGLLPEELWVLPNNDLTTFNQSLSFYENPPFYYFNDGVTQKKIQRDDLIIIKLPNNKKGNNISEGLSPLQSVWETVLSSNNRAEAEKSLFENKGATGIVSPKALREGNRIPEQIFLFLQDKLKSLIGGADKANKVVTVASPVDFTQIGMSATDLKIIESRSGHIQDICNAYQFPSQLLGDEKANQHSNYESALKSVYTDTVIPTANLIINGLEKFWLNDVNGVTGSNYYFKVNTGKIEAINPHWVKRLLEMPTDLQMRILATITDNELNQIKNEIGLSYE